MTEIISTLLFVVAALGYVVALRWCLEYEHNWWAAFLIVFLVFLVTDSDIYLEV